MEHAVERVVDVYREFLTHADPRSENWLFCRSPLIPVVFVANYLYFVKRCGPRFMASRPPYDVKNIMIAYNVTQIVSNAYACLTGTIVWVSQLKSLTCQPVDLKDTPANAEMANLVYMYYVLKIADLIDTVFFVLRKKNNQATFLHVYHHCAMVFAGYLSSRFLLNGHVVLMGILNTFVHTVLYSYYLLTAIWPSTREAIWKKYITVLQLTQFAIVFIHNVPPLLLPDCDVQRVWHVVLVVQSAFMFTMFYDFYIKAYCSKKKRTA